MLGFTRNSAGMNSTGDEQPSSVPWGLALVCPSLFSLSGVSNSRLQMANTPWGERHKLLVQVCNTEQVTMTRAELRTALSAAPPAGAHPREGDASRVPRLRAQALVLFLGG